MRRLSEAAMRGLAGRWRRLSASPEEAHRVQRRIALTSAALVLLPLAALLLFLVQQAVRLDRLDGDHMRAIAAQAVATRLKALERVTPDYAHWDEAYRRLTLRYDPIWASNNLGPAAWPGMTVRMKAVFYVDGGGRIRSGTVDGRSVSGPLARHLSAAAAGMVARARRQDAPVGRIIEVDGRPLVTVAMAVRPATAELERPDVRRGVLIWAEAFAAPMLRDMIDMHGLAGLRWGDGPSRAGENRMAVVTTGGRPAGALYWRQSRPGMRLLREAALPGLLLVLACVAIGFTQFRVTAAMVALMERRRRTAETQAREAEHARVEAEAASAALEARERELATVHAERNREQAEARRTEAATRRAMADEFAREVAEIVASVGEVATGLEARSRLLLTQAEIGTAALTSVGEARTETAGAMGRVATCAMSLRDAQRALASATGETLATTDQASGTSREASGMADRLVEQTRSIHRVLSTVTNISGQISMLALNATIEAARAGEAGRGFAVVASEVKHLSAGTTQAADQIRVTLTDIGGATDAIAGAVARLQAVVTEVGAHAAHASEAVAGQDSLTAAIDAAIGRVSDRFAATEVELDRLAQGLAASDEAAHDLVRLAAELGARVGRLSQGSARFTERLGAAV